jgi:hypothetical protein
MSHAKKNRQGINNIVVVSDLHSGCRLALCPPGDIALDDGGTYRASKQQRWMYSKWKEFWESWVPLVTMGEPFSVVHNGDVIDGSHHGSVTQISQNIADQREIAYSLLKPIVDLCEGRFYSVRGTEAHVNKSASDENEVAKRLGAIPNDQGQNSRWELRKMVGEALVDFQHHVGVSGSNHYESTAVHKELVEAFTEAGRWGARPPDVVVRSHRHRCIETRIPSSNGQAISFVTAGWQGKSPFAYRIAGGRQASPQYGGSLIRWDAGGVFTRHMVWTPERGEPE